MRIKCAERGRVGGIMMFIEKGVKKGLQPGLRIVRDQMRKDQLSQQNSFCIQQLTSSVLSVIVLLSFQAPVHNKIDLKSKI